MGGFLSRIRDAAHRYDPLGANLVDNMIRTDSRVVAEVSRGSDRVSQAIGLGGLTDPAGRTIRRESRANIADPSRAVGRAAATVALMYGFGAMAGGGTAAGAGEAAAAGGTGGTAAGGSYLTGTGGAQIGLAGGDTLGGWQAGSAVYDGSVGFGFEAGLGAGAAGAASGYAAGEAAGNVAGEAAAPAGTGGKVPGTTPNPYGQALRSFATGVGTNVATSLLMPKPKQPAIEPVTEMPDPEAQALARRRKAAQKRQGRTASILTSGG